MQVRGNGHQAHPEKRRDVLGTLVGLRLAGYVSGGHVADHSESLRQQTRRTAGSSPGVPGTASGGLHATTPM